MKKIILVILLVLCITGCNSEKEEQKITRTLVENTSWIGADNSEIIFTDTKVSWYQSKYEHDDNYYLGTYEFYIGDEAVKFITTNLSNYNVTENELETLFQQNNNYNRENFVVFNLLYETLTINGETSTLTTSQVPWFGFILEDNTYLDVANMNTGTYYDFKLNYVINY